MKMNITFPLMLARLELMIKPGLSDQEKPSNCTGYAHVAFSVGSKERLDALTNELSSARYEVVSGLRTTSDESICFGMHE
jgi:lactoylglutathione lyase